MSATDTMRWMSRSARNRAQAMGHAVKDRSLEKRLDRATEEADRLRFENDRLRGEVQETRTEHHRILDMLETRLAAPEVEMPEVEMPEVEMEAEKRSHRGRWLMLLMAVGGGAYALIRMRSPGSGHEWAGSHDSPAVTETGAAAV